MKCTDCQTDTKLITFRGKDVCIDCALKNHEEYLQEFLKQREFKEK